VKTMTRDGFDGDDGDKDLLDHLIEQETAIDPDFPQKLEDELQRQRQVRETREALASESVVSLEDWRNSSDGDQAKAILGRLRADKGKAKGKGKGKDRTAVED
jgi:hypothetical protein